MEEPLDHQLAERMRQRTDGLACGYADANDAARIGAATDVAQQVFFFNTH